MATVEKKKDLNSERRKNHEELRQLIGPRIKFLKDISSSKSLDKPLIINEVIFMQIFGGIDQLQSKYLNLEPRLEDSELIELGEIIDGLIAKVKRRSGEWLPRRFF